MARRNKGVALAPEMIRHLWKQLLVRLGKNLNVDLPAVFLDHPEEFWKDQNLRRCLISDLKEKTTFKVSRILLIRYEEDEITEDYLNNHFVKMTQQSFQPGYLDRFAFYLSGGKTKYWNDYKAAVQGYVPEHGDDAYRLILPGLKKLEGYWVGINKNSRDGKYVKCRYRIWQDANVMKVEREGYNTEICFLGNVIMQQDGSFAFILHGKERKGFKHLIAHGESDEPLALKSISTAMSYEIGSPVLVKEFLYKVPGEHAIHTAEVMDFSKLSLALENDVGERSVEVLRQIGEFLGEEEASVFSMNDLNLIKNRHLAKIKDEATKGDHMMIHLQEPPGAGSPDRFTGQRSRAARFYHNRMNNLEKGVRIGREIYEDYIFMKILNVKFNLQLNILFNFQFKFLRKEA